MQIIDVNGSKREANKVFVDPEYPGFMRIEFRRHHEWMSVSEFVEKNPSLSKLADKSKPVAADVVGTVTSSTTKSMSDTKQKWVENDYLGYFVWISRGKGEGQKRTVIKNNHNKLTIDQPWDTKPDTSSQYVISHNVKEVRAMGNTLPTEDIKELERIAAERDIARGRVNKDLKYIEVKDPVN